MSYKTSILSYLYGKISLKQDLVWLLDIDDTILNLGDRWIAMYNEDYSDSLKKQDIKTWDIASYTKISNEMYDYLSLPDLYENVEPVDNALEAVNQIRKLPNSRIIYCTHVMGHPGQKYDRLCELGFIQDEDQYFEGFSKTSIDKNIFKANIAIDDNYKHIARFNGSMGILFNAPWNENEKHEPRLKDWNEFLYIMEKLHEIYNY